MSEKANKRFTITFDADTKELARDVEQAKKLVKSVGLAAESVRTTTDKRGKTSLTVAGTGQGSTAEINKRLAEAQQAALLQKQNINLAKRSTVAYDNRRVSVRKATTQQKAFNRSVAKTSKEIGNANRKHKLSVRHVLRYSGAYASASAALGGFVVALASIPQIGMEMQATQAVFEATFGGVEGAAEQLEFLNSVAHESSIAIGTLRANYRNFSASTKLVGVSTEETQQIFKNLSETARALHLNTDEVQGTFRAVTQIFNKNKIMAEELQNQLGERVPGAVGIMAKAYQNLTGHVGDATQVLNKAMEQGLVKPQGMMLEFTRLLREQFTAAYEKSLTSLQARLVDTGNAWDIFANKAFNSAESFLVGVTEFATATIEFATENITVLKNAIKATITVFAALYVAKFAGAIAQTYKLVAANLILSKSFIAVNTSAKASMLGGFGKKAVITKKQISGLSSIVKQLSTRLSKIPNPYAKLGAVGAFAVAVALDFEELSNTTVTFGGNTAKATSVAKEAWKDFVEAFTATTIIGTLKRFKEAASSILGGVFPEIVESAKGVWEGFVAKVTEQVKVAGQITGLTKYIDKLTEAAAAREALTADQAKADKIHADNLATAQKILDDAFAADEAYVSSIFSKSDILVAEDKKRAEAAEKAAERIQKSHANELLSLDMQIAKLKENTVEYSRLRAKQKKYSASMQEEVNSREAVIISLEKVKAQREEEAKLLKESEEAHGKLLKTFETIKNLRDLLESGGSLAQIEELKSLEEIEEKVSKLAPGLQDAHRSVLLTHAANEQFVQSSVKGLQLIKSLKQEIASIGQVEVPNLEGINPAQEEEATRLFNERQFLLLEQRMMTEEERLEQSYKRRADIIWNAENISGERQIALLDKLENERKKRKKQAQIDNLKVIVGGFNEFTSSLASLAEATAGKSEKSQKRLFAIQKGIAIAQATVAAYTAAMQATQAGISVPEKLAYYATMFGHGVSAIAAIKGVQPEVNAGAFATGGAFTVPGSGGTDSQTVRFAATPGERVTVETPAQQQANKSSANPVNIVVNNNTTSEVQVTDSLNELGEQIIDIIIEDVQTSDRFSQTLQRNFSLNRTAN